MYVVQAVKHTDYHHVHKVYGKGEIGKIENKLVFKDFHSGDSKYSKSSEQFEPDANV